MHAHRDVYQAVMKIVTDHGALSETHFFGYLSDWYGTTQSVAARRQADRNPRVDTKRLDRLPSATGAPIRRRRRCLLRSRSVCCGSLQLVQWERSPRMRERRVVRG